MQDGVSVSAQLGLGQCEELKDQAEILALRKEVIRRSEVQEEKESLLAQVQSVKKRKLQEDY